MTSNGAGDAARLQSTSQDIEQSIISVSNSHQGGKATSQRLPHNRRQIRRETDFVSGDSLPSGSEGRSSSTSSLSGPITPSTPSRSPSPALTACTFGLSDTSSVQLDQQSDAESQAHASTFKSTTDSHYSSCLEDPDTTARPSAHRYDENPADGQDDRHEEPLAPTHQVEDDGTPNRTSLTTVSTADDEACRTPSSRQLSHAERQALKAWLRIVPTLEGAHPRYKWRRGSRESPTKVRLAWLNLEEYSFRYVYRPSHRRADDQKWTEMTETCMSLFWISHNDHPAGFDNSASKSMKVSPALIPKSLILQYWQFSQLQKQQSGNLSIRQPSSQSIVSEETLKDHDQKPEKVVEGENAKESILALPNTKQCEDRPAQDSVRARQVSKDNDTDASFATTLSSEGDEDVHYVERNTMQLLDVLKRTQDIHWKVIHDAHWLDTLAGIESDEKESIRCFIQQQGFELLQYQNEVLQPPPNCSSSVVTDAHQYETSSAAGFSSGELAEIEEELLRQEDEKGEVDCNARCWPSHPSRTANEGSQWKHRGKGRDGHRASMRPSAKTARAEASLPLTHAESTPARLASKEGATLATPQYVPDYAIPRAPKGEQDNFVITSRVNDIRQHLSHIVEQQQQRQRQQQQQHFPNHNQPQQPRQHRHQQQPRMSQWSEVQQQQQQEQQLAFLAQLHRRHQEALESHMRQAWAEQQLQRQEQDRLHSARLNAPLETKEMWQEGSTAYFHHPLDLYRSASLDQARSRDLSSETFEFESPFTARPPRLYREQGSSTASKYASSLTDVGRDGDEGYSPSSSTPVAYPLGDYEQKGLSKLLQIQQQSQRAHEMDEADFFAALRNRKPDLAYRIGRESDSGKALSRDTPQSQCHPPRAPKALRNSGKHLPLQSVRAHPQASASTEAGNFRNTPYEGESKLQTAAEENGRSHRRDSPAARRNKRNRVLVSRCKGSRSTANTTMTTST